jgi:hypothetical protein
MDFELQLLKNVSLEPYLCCLPLLPLAAAKNAGKSYFLTYTAYKSSKNALFKTIIIDSYRQNIQKYPFEKEML